MAICTYNVGEIKADCLKNTDPITKMFEEMKTNDMVIINLQEVDMNIKYFNSSAHDGKFNLWTDYLDKIFDLSLFHRTSLPCGTLMMIVYWNFKTSNYIKYYENKEVFLGGGGFGNKAAISLHVI